MAYTRDPAADRNTRYFPDHPPLLVAEKDAVRRSRDWLVCVLGDGDAAQARADLSGDRRALTRRWDFLARDKVSVPAAYEADVAFVYDQDELTWLRLWHEFLGDTERMRKA